MKLHLSRLLRWAFGYCLRHHRYGRPCMGCVIEEHLNHPDFRKLKTVTKMNIEIIDASFHRNGICGEGFHAILFQDHSLNKRMVASLFPEPGYCAVYCVAELMVGNISFANGNSWRGDQYEAQLRPLLEKWEDKHGSNQIGPFAFPSPYPKKD